jgi:predicted dehydrogenase
MDAEKRKLKVVFLGGGLDSAVGSAHYSAINLENSFELVAGFFSTDKEINFMTAKEYSVPKNRVYDHIDALIEKEKKNIDAAIVLTPTDCHVKHVVSLINNDIPVICEKSLACSVAEVEKIRAVLKKKNAFLSVISSVRLFF